MKLYDVIFNSEPGSVFVATETVDETSPVKPAPWVRITESEFEARKPRKVRSSRQRPFWLALRQLHPEITRSGVKALLPSLPGLAGNAGAIEDALVEFDTAQTVEDTNPLLPLVRAVYSLSEDDVTAVFDLADTIA